MVLTSDGSAYEGQVRAQTAEGLAGVSKDAEAAGQDAGGALSTGIKDGTKGIEDDMGSLGERSGGALAKGAESGEGGGIKSLLGSVGIPEALLGGWGALGLAVVGVGVASVDLAMNMQQADSQIAASADISQGAATKIGNAFLTTAGQTTFSAIDMAKAYAGVAGQLGSTEGGALSAAQALTVMKAAGDLAESTGTSLTSATTDLSKAMQAFQLPVSQADKATDSLFNTARLTGVGVDTLTGSLTKIRSSAGGGTQTIQDLSGALVDLANNNESGRKGLTALTGALTSLAVPSAAVLATQKQMGVSFLDSSGNVDSFGQLIAKANPLIQGMDANQAAATLTSLGFGKASAALVQTIQSGPEYYQAMADSANKVGSAHDAAEKSTDNLQGAMEKAKVGAEDLGTSLGQKLVGGAQTAFNFIQTNWPAISATFSKVFHDIGLVVTTVMTIVMTVVKVNTDIIKGIWSVFGGAITTVVTMLWDSIKDIFQGAFDIIQGIVKLFIDIFEGHWSSAWKDVQQILFGAWELIKGVVEEALAIIEFILTTAWDAIRVAAEAVWTGIVDAVKLIFTGIVDFFKLQLDAIVWLFTTTWHLIVDGFTKLPGDILNGIGDLVGIVFSGLSGAWNWIKKNAYDPIVSGFKGLPGDIASVIGGAIGSLGSIGKAITNALIGGLDDAIDFYNSHRPSVLGVSLMPALPDIPKLASGGIVKATPGGMLAILGEGGHDEAVVPLSGSGGRSASNSGTALTVNVNPGAVVINPASGNDAASLAATQRMIDDAFTALTQELQAGLNPLGAVGA